MKKNGDANMIDKHKKMKNSSKLFFSGVLILTVSNLIVKAIGLLFKIPMNAIVGDEGMGYYNTSYTFYTFLYMLSTAGLPTAISIMISESRATGKIKQSKIILRNALILFIFIGFISMVLLMLFSGILASAIGSSPTKYCILAIAPTMMFICVSSALRGYFQGYQQMLPVAVSQLTEAAGKLGIGIALALYALHQNYPIYIVAAYATIGFTMGAFLGMMFLTLAKLMFKENRYNAEFLADRKQDDSVQPSRQIYKRLLWIAIPITVSASVMSLTNLIDTAIVQKLLQMTGLSQVTATEIYGNYTSLAVPMFNLPPVLIYPIAYSIVPLITAARSRGDNHRSKLIMDSVMRVAMLVGIPCALGLAALARPILSLFFKASSVALATPLLTLLAPSTAFICILSVTNAILQSNGYERKPLIAMVIGAIVKITSNIILIQIIGMKSTPISTFLCYLTVTCINFHFLRKYVGLTPKLTSVFVKPLIAGVICAVCAYGSYQLFSDLLPLKLATVGAIGTAGIVYAVLIFMMKAITGDDIRLLPKGEKIYGLLHKMKLVN